MNCPHCHAPIPAKTIRSEAARLAGSKTSPAKKKSSRANAQARWDAVREYILADAGREGSHAARHGVGRHNSPYRQRRSQTEIKSDNAWLAAWDKAKGI